MPEPRYLFLSHNSDDKPDVEKLVQLIESHDLAQQHNLKVWLDKNDLEHGVQYTNQFARYINHTNTCAFILFMPKDPIRAYVEYEINVAFNRQMNDKNDGKPFPLLPVYPKESEERQALPEVIGTYNYREHALESDPAIKAIISNALGLKLTSEPQPDEVGNNYGTSNTPQPEQWLCYDLIIENNTIVSQTETGFQKKELPLDILTDAVKDQRKLSSIMQQLFPSIFANGMEAPKRLRIRTDAPELAMLPWAVMHETTVIELSPLASHYRPNFASLNVSTPLVIIPTKPPEIAANTHYRLFQEYCHAYFNIHGPIPRVTNNHLIKQEIQDHKPDLIYLYARVNGGHIQLDEPSGDEPFTLEQLGSWIEAAEIRPMVILSMLGSELTEYPATLAKQCRLLWTQSTNSKLIAKSQQIEDNLANTLEKLAQELDLVKNINTNFSNLRIAQNLWVNSQSPQLDISKYQLNQQLRVALLRVLLGRKGLKNNLYAEIKQKKTNGSCVSYAITGDTNACPFDVPTQLQQLLDWDEAENGLPIIPFHLPLTISDAVDPIDCIEQLIDSSLMGRAGDIRGTFQGELDRRGLDESECCIALNWNITVPPQMSVELSEWLKVWGEFMQREVIDDIPSTALLLNAICLQVADADNAQEVQKTANNELQQLRRQNIGLIRIVDALGKLENYEISDFFEDNPEWREALKLDTYDINPYDYADWIHRRSNEGEFEQTVKLIWQQYQNDYQDYTP